MQLADVAAAALPQFCRALKAGLEAAARADPDLGDVSVANIAVSVRPAADGEDFFCSAEVAGESPLSSYVHLPDLDDATALFEHFLSDVEDWIVESHFGWGLKLH